MKRKYIVSGNHDGVEIDKEVEATTSKQAKLIAGFREGFGGTRAKEFLRDKSIKVREVK